MILEQVVSRYDPGFDVAGAQLGLGRDGQAYLVYAGRVLRTGLDGSSPFAGEAGYSALGATANAAGTIATAEAHFPHRVAFWDAGFGALGHIADFTTNDEQGWNAPSAIEAGESGDFYAIDQYENRALRLNPQGVVAVYVLPPLGPTVKHGLAGMRVSERRSRLYTSWPSGVFVTGFDGTRLWDVPVRAAGAHLGGFDVADDGKLYVLVSGNEVRIFDENGGAAGTLTLALPDNRYTVSNLRIRGNEIFLKRTDPTTLFEVYDRTTGKPLRRAAADVERLTVSYADPVWAAGKPVPLAITHDSGRWKARPRFRVWTRPLGVPEFTELRVDNGAVTPPAAARGLYHLRVSPDVAGRYSEYTVDGVVEVRAPGSTGTVSVMTPLNRFYYGRGERIPVTLLARAKAGTALPAAVKLRILKSGTEIGTRDVTLTNGKGEVILDGDWQPDRYTLDADVPGFTVAPQYLEVGPGLVERPDFHVVQHGDYAQSFPEDPRGKAQIPRFADVPEITQAHLERAGKLGITLFADRIGHVPEGRFQKIPADVETVARLGKDPEAISPEKAHFEDWSRRAIAGYGSRSMEEQGILLYMDAGLPLGKPYDTRTPEKMVADIKTVTGFLAAYPAFRGWSWAANWWLTKLGGDAAADETEKAAYLAAWKVADETGKWSPVLDTVSDRAFALKVDAEKLFRAAMDSVAPGRISAMTAPYRAVQSPPQILFANADEVDLQYQSEQIQPPQVTGHAVDFYRRPGKPVWGHPELFNDDGTGGMFLPTLVQQVMRGANGTGMVGDAGRQHIGATSADPRTGGTGARLGDPRAGGAGKTSVLRAAFGLAAEVGPAIAAARTGDRVAIVVSTRMQRAEGREGGISGWNGKIGGKYFDSLFEAYNACLYAHRPASFVFTEDVSAEVLKRYDAVLLVGQRMELDPPLAAALRDSGVPVYFDGTCRAELVAGFTPLGIGFDKVSRDPVAHNDDSAYPRFRRYFLDHAETVRKVLADVRPVAECDNPEVLLSEWTDGDVRYVWAVNNTLLDWDPGQMWRVGLSIGHRVPVMAELDVELPLLHRVVDVLTGKDVSLIGGRFTADLRSAPARLYAIVPLLHKELPKVTPDTFGPHVRDVAVSADGKSAMLGCFNWDHNLYGLDLGTGKATWRRKIGHHFGFAPSVHKGGFAAQGFDLDTAEGHHLYLLDDAGKPRRRFALFGRPKRATDWARGEWIYDTGLDNFAVAPAGTWVATSGDLGMVVWDGAGKQLWARERWTTSRTPHRLLAVDDKTLVAFAGGKITGLSAVDGRELWSVDAARTGVFLGGAVSADGKTIAIWSDTDGGRLFVLRGGVLVNTLPIAAEEVSLSADGSLIVVAEGDRLDAFAATGGLLWTFTGDDLMRRPRVSPDGTKIAAGSELGTLYVLDAAGALLTRQDLRALPVPSWLPGGDLLAATWMGTVVRYGADLKPRWRTRIAPEETDARSKLRAPDPTPTTRKTGWGNASAEPLPLVPNLIADTRAFVTAESVRPKQILEGQYSAEILRDGKADPPPGPWLRWHDIGFVNSGWRDELVLKVDTFRTRVRLTGVTFAEDPGHPESWLRDVRLQWWDGESEVWRDGPLLLSDKAVHSHVFERPIEASRFRFVSTGGGSWPNGNIRLGELVFHGEQLGNSHRDVVAKRPRAVLFDERVKDLDMLLYPPTFAFRQGGAFSGGTCLELTAAGEAHPAYRAPFGHAVPDWDFKIAENPEPGQYRYFQFAWKATSPETTGIGLRLGGPWPGLAVCASVGDSRWLDHTVLADHRVPGAPPTEWAGVRIDLWAITGGKPPVIQGLGLRSNGGGALFDRLVLGRTEADL